MSTKAIVSALALGALVLLSLGLLSACDFEPDPAISTQDAFAAQTVRLEAKPDAAADAYWLFHSRPAQDVASFTLVGLQAAEFVPSVAGEYIVDRWAVTGPSSVWTDRFIVNVADERPELAIEGTRVVSLGDTEDYSVNRVDSVSSYNWLLSRPASMESSYQELVPQEGGAAAFTPEITGTYSISCFIVDDTGAMETATLSVEVTED